MATNTQSTPAHASAPELYLVETDHRGTLYDGEGSVYGHLYHDPGRPKNRAEDRMIRLLDGLGKGERLKEEAVGAGCSLAWLKGMGTRRGR